MCALVLFLAGWSVGGFDVGLGRPVKYYVLYDGVYNTAGVCVAQKAGSEEKK